VVAHADEVVAEYPQTDPGFHAVLAFVAAAVQAMAALENADPAFTASSPFLPFLEPAFLLKFPALRTFGRAIRHRDPIDSHLVAAFSPRAE